MFYNPAISKLGFLCLTLSLRLDAKTYPTRFPGVEWHNDDWALTTTVLDQGHYQSRMSLSNGYLGINLAALGPFFERDRPLNATNGWPLFDSRQTFATIAGFFDSQPNTTATNFPWLNQYGGESVISGVPHWAGLLIKTSHGFLNSSTDPVQISDFYSKLDLKAGLLEWSFKWQAPGQPVISIKYSMFVNKLQVNQAVVQLKMQASEDVQVSVIDILDGECAVRTDYVEKQHDARSRVICTAVSPVGVRNITAHVCSALRSSQVLRTESIQDGELISSSPSTIAQAATIQLHRAQTVVVEKFIGGASSDAFRNPKHVALNASLSGAKTGYSAQLTSHQAEWKDLMAPESVDNYTIPEKNTLPTDSNVVELQILAITTPFHLLQNTISPNAIANARNTTAFRNSTALDIWSISVCGLGADCYGGLIFWDAEVWMAPGLVVSHPDAARQIINYRVEKFPQAQKNLNMSISSSQNQTNQFSAGGAVYPWTSGRYGNCTGTGPCFDYEYHINGDVGLSLYNYLIATGNFGLFKQKLFPIYDSIAMFFSQLLKYDPAREKYILTNATDPDEYANNVNNPAFTMALIATHLTTANQLRTRFGVPANDTWSKQAEQIALPIDKQIGIILEYEGMNSSISVKQADVVLIDDFLDYSNPYSLSNMDYYGKKQSLNGPGMTYGVYSIVANKFSPTGCASFTYDLYGSQPYARQPWFQFSEQLVDDFAQNGGTHPAFPFLTGMGSAYRVALYGYLGLRLRLDHLNVDPSLPPQIPWLAYRTFYWHGHAIKAMSNQTHTILFRPPFQQIASADPYYTVAAIPVTIGSSTTRYRLQTSIPLTIPNRVSMLSDPIQCQPIQSEQGYLPAQFPVAVNDGSSATLWSPSTLPATLTAKLNPVFSTRSITGFAFQNSSFENFSISFFDDPSSVQRFSQGDFGSGSSLVKNENGWRNYTLKASIKPTRYVNLTVFGEHSLNVSKNQDLQSSPSIAEWILLTA